MSERFNLECCIRDLQRAKEHAIAANMNWYFCSEIDHLVETAQANIAPDGGE